MTLLFAGARPFRGGTCRNTSHRHALCSFIAVLLCSGCNALVNFAEFKFSSDAGAAPGVRPQDAGPQESDSGQGGGVKQPDAGKHCMQTSETACNDRLDNDCDGLEDCDDPDCANQARCCRPNEIPEVSCAGGADNDCDGKVDCDDSDCAASNKCCVATGAEVGNTACSDGIDNDCDGVLDCKEAGCAAQTVCCVAGGSERDTKSCGDGLDNDCDGKRDCQDPDCAVVASCCTKSEPSESKCDDASDNDCDGLADCRDPDCEQKPICTQCLPTATTESSCIDKKDNDCDKDADCYDADCASAPSCCVPMGPEGDEQTCADGHDNDCDGLMDCADPQCRAALACCVATGAESGDVACSDEIDNDCDGKLNCEDTGCAGSQNCCAAVGAEKGVQACADGMDNDCDRAIDCADPDCAAESMCCTPNGAESTRPNDGQDNDCDGRVDIPQLSAAYPPPNLPSAGAEVALSFVPSIVAGAVLECSTRRMSLTGVPRFDTCPGTGNVVNPHSDLESQDATNDGAWVTDVRWRFPNGARSEVFTFRHYIHHTLHKVSHCPQIDDSLWFAKAAERLLSPKPPLFKPDVMTDTFLGAPFVHVTYEPPLANNLFLQDGRPQTVEMWSLRRRFALSQDNRMLLITRNYVSSHTQKCYAAYFRVHNTLHTNHKKQLGYECEAVVLNRAGAGVCLINSKGTVQYQHSSNDPMANVLGWGGADKFMWRQLTYLVHLPPVKLGPGPLPLTDRPFGDVHNYRHFESGAYRNFTPKCSVQPCNGNAIFLPDRSLFP